MDILICGASARAAAFSALRAGLRPVAFDLFADRDLTSLCPACRIPSERYPSALVDLFDSVPASAWLYTGALENHPELVDEVSKRHCLLGNGGTALRAVRDPVRVANVFEKAGLDAPRVELTPVGLPDDGSWLVKPLASGGGLAIRVFDGGGPVREAVYYQQRIDGVTLSAVFVGDGGGATFVGVTRQLTGRPGAPFAYGGSVGPWPLLPSEQDLVETLGRVIASAFSLVGLFGIDFILRDGHPWPVEINPRYTASVEVLELALGRTLLKEHVRACLSHLQRPGQPPSSFPRSARERSLGRSASRSSRVQSLSAGIAGKMIVFADRPCRFPPLGKADCDQCGMPMIADIPQEGTSFEPGDPVMTVFATAETVSECQARLEHHRREWLERLRAT